MLLYIVRHAHAGQHGDHRYPDDALRPLTKKGHRQFTKVVKKLSRRGFAPELIVTSPLVRCRQTAEIIARKAGTSPEVVELGELAPGSELDALVAWTRGQAEQAIAWVGHAPDVDRLTAGLVGASQSAFALAKGAIAAIEFEDQIAPGEGILRWLVTPDVLGA